MLISLTNITEYYHKERHKLALTMFAIVAASVLYTLTEVQNCFTHIHTCIHTHVCIHSDPLKLHLPNKAINPLDFVPPEFFYLQVRSSTSLC